MARKKMIVPVREPNGRLSRATEAAVGACSPAEARRLRDAAISGIRGPEWGTEIGRLFLAGKLESEIFEAGKRWGRLAASYYQTIGANPPYPRAQAFMGERIPKATDPDEDTPEFKRLLAHDKAIIKDMKEAHAVLIGAGKMAEQAVRSVCEGNEAPVGQYGLESLDRGLRWLAKHWGLTKEARNVRLSA